MEKLVRAALFCAFLAIAADYANGLYPVIMSELHYTYNYTCADNTISIFLDLC